MAYEDDIRSKIQSRQIAGLEASVRSHCERLGVDPELSPKDRCMAIMKATGMVRVAQTLVAQARKQPDRVPGEDDE